MKIQSILGITLLALPLLAFSAGDPGKQLRRAGSLMQAGDYEAAYAEYLKHARNGNGLASFNLALFHQNGWGGMGDPVLACQFHGEAAERDIPASAHFYGLCLVDGTAGTPDPAGAAQWFSRATELGHFVSDCNLGELYMSGSGVEKNPSKAIELCTAAAARDSVPAQIQLAQMLEHGDASVRDAAGARHWYQMAAERNSPLAQYRYATMLRDGIGGEADPSAALWWYETAAGQGWQDAYLPTGELYLMVRDDEDTLPADALAKAYLWVSAATKSLAGDQKLASEKLLAEILVVMPPTWVAELDAKVSAHMEKYPVADSAT